MAWDWRTDKAIMCKMLGTKNVVAPFIEENEYLSNFWMEQFKWLDWYVKSAEHAYQMMKYWPDIRKMMEVLNAPTPYAAKQAGRKYPQNHQFEENKVFIMELIVRQKFLQLPHLGSRLVATGNAMIVELNWWRDNFWGWCINFKKGETERHNHLGQILMRTRNILAERI